MKLRSLGEVIGTDGMQRENILFIQIESPTDMYAIELLSRVKCTNKKTTTTRDSFVCTLVRNRILSLHYWGFPDGSESKESDCNAGDIRDMGSIPGLGRSPREGNGNPFQYSCLENPMDRGAWQATVHGVARVGHDLVTK